MIKNILFACYTFNQLRKNKAFSTILFDFIAWTENFEASLLKLFRLHLEKKPPQKCSKKKSSLLVKKIEVSKIGDWLGRKTKNIPIENSYLSLLHYLHKYESESAVKFPTL